MLSLFLFVSSAIAHTAIKSLVIDGNIYAPFDSRIDNFLEPVKRIQWSFDYQKATFNPITNFSDPNIACRQNAKPPVLKAKARAGAEISLNWTPITRMHNGPALAYLGYLPTPDTKPQDVKFFKIFEHGFDTTHDRWANQVASDNADSFKVQLPSDIKPGTYILRAELIALHGNMEDLSAKSLRGEVQLYPYCFNIEITGNGNAVPEGVTFPGAYKTGDPGLTFAPYFKHEDPVQNATAYNSRYVPPGPPKYNGKYDAPTGPRPVVTTAEAGIYAPDLNVKYQDLIRRIERPALKLATYVNTAWPYYQASAEVMKLYGKVAAAGIKESTQNLETLKPEIEAFRKESTA